MSFSDGNEAIWEFDAPAASAAGSTGPSTAHAVGLVGGPHVRSRSAPNVIAARVVARDEIVVPVAAVEGIRVGVPDQPVVPGFPTNDVSAIASDKDVVAATAVDGVVAPAAEDRVCTPACVDGVVPIAGADDVRPGRAVQLVWTTRSLDRARHRLPVAREVVALPRVEKGGELASADVHTHQRCTISAAEQDGGAVRGVGRGYVMDRLLREGGLTRTIGAHAPDVFAASEHDAQAVGSPIADELGVRRRVREVRDVVPVRVHNVEVIVPETVEAIEQDLRPVRRVRR